jgi:hypothetical protein
VHEPGGTVACRERPAARGARPPMPLDASFALILESRGELLHSEVDLPGPPARAVFLMMD